MHVSLFLRCSDQIRRQPYKAGGNVKGRPSGSVAKLAECSHGKREALKFQSKSGHDFSSPLT